MNPGSISTRATIGSSATNEELGSSIPAGEREDRATSHRRSIKRRFRKAHRHADKLGEAIKKAFASGNRQKQKKALRNYLISADAVLIAAESANRKLPVSRRYNGATLIELSYMFDPFSEELEPVGMFYHRKASVRRLRAVMHYGFRHQLRQFLCSNALSYTYEPHHQQFAVRSRGRDEAVRAVIAAIRNGAKWYAEFDVASYYSSVGMANSARTAVPYLTQWLLLPERIVTNCITAVGYSYRCHVHRNSCAAVSLRIDSRAGVPTGSIASSFISERCTAELLRQIEGVGPRSDVDIVNFGDNFALLSKTKSEIYASTQPLVRAFARSPHGSFRLEVKCGPRGVWHGFEFLGYWIRYRKGSLEIRPTDANFESFRRKCKKHLRKLANRATHTIEPLKQFVLSWCAAFKLCSAIFRFAARVLRQQAGRYCFDRLHEILPLYEWLWERPIEPSPREAYND